MKLILIAAFALTLLSGCTAADKEYIREHVVEGKQPVKRPAAAAAQPVTLSAK